MKFGISCSVVLLLTISGTVWSAEQSIGFRKQREKGSLVYYSGAAIVEGKFSYSSTKEDQERIGDQVCFYPTKKDGKLIPREDDQRMPWFCFTDTRQAKELLGISELIKNPEVCNVTGQATIEIRNYVVDKAETGTNDTAELVRVIEKSGGSPTASKAPSPPQSPSQEDGGK